MRVDLRLIAGMVAEKTRVLDIGCGDGSLIDYLFRTKQCDARGLEIDMAEVTRAITHGLPVMQGDADSDLANYPDAAFDYVILSRTLQAVERPREVLRQMLRISTYAIVSFPNFGHWTLRLQLLLGGKMPMTKAWHPICAGRMAIMSSNGWPRTRPAPGRLGGDIRDWRICSASRGCFCCGRFRRV
jgi:methionine biosynthesis protein MetW